MVVQHLRILQYASILRYGVRSSDVASFGVVRRASTHREPTSFRTTGTGSPIAPTPTHLALREDIDVRAMTQTRFL